MKSFSPEDHSTSQMHSLLLSAIAPRPIAFVSTADAQGRHNLAPFSFFNIFSTDPPIVIFSPSRRVRNNTIKHTLQNVQEVREVVINLVDHALLHQMNLASSDFPEGVNEFEKAGLTAIDSDLVIPKRVKESPVQLECTVKDIVPLGSEGGAGNLVVCQVVRVHVAERVLDETGKIAPDRIDLIARMGGNWYARASGNAIFEVNKPGRNIGIGVDAIPPAIRSSHVLTGNDLGLLGMVSELPGKDEVAAFAALDTTLEIIQGLSPNEITGALHTAAQTLLRNGNISDAWRMLLSDMSN